MLTLVRAALLILAAALPSAVLAQTPVPPAAANQGIVLTPPDAPRWDTAFNIGWFGGNRPDTAAGGNHWYDAAAVDGSVGFYWTPHVKLDFTLTAMSPGDVYVGEPISVPGVPFQPYRFREHRINQTAGAMGIAYQFLENQSFHPFVGGGAVVVHQSDRARRSESWTYQTGPQSWTVLPPLPEQTETSTFVRPFAALGFKAYFNERVFFRTDTRFVVSSEGAESITWRVGLGWDF